MIVRLIMLFNLSLVVPCLAQSVTTFEDIEYWVGNDNSCSTPDSTFSCAALVIDWNGESSKDVAIAWGYSWEGTATAETMLRDILQADNRLFAKLGSFMGFGLGVFGLGYDGNNDLQLQLDDNTSFDSAGIAMTGPSDLTIANDPVDLYAEGWEFGFWHVATTVESSPSGNNWTSASFGVSGVELSDGQWVSLAFTTDTESDTAVAENLLAADVLFSSGDFQPDSLVDDLDLAIWRNGFGTTILVEEGIRVNKQFGNADGDRDVDGVDFLLWQRNFSLLPSGAAATQVPEPTTIGVFALGLICLLKISTGDASND